MNKSNLHNKHNLNHSYNDYEMNELNYKNALKLDRRSFCQYYLSLLRTKHILIFSFFYHRDYNSSMIKIYMFFLTFSMNYVISAMFYSDSTMHQIYVDDGSFNITYQIPQMFYSFIISSALENILNILGLYESDIADFKKHNKSKKDKKKLFAKIKFKITSFFIIETLLIFFFWIYLGCFCAVYKNTQIHLMLDVSSSFGISFITPFFNNLFPSFFRIISLRDKKGKSQLLFKFSNILQNIV